MQVVSDRTLTIRASLAEIQKALAISVGLVIVVVGLFLRRLRSALIPSVAVPVSLAGTFAGMYLLGYSLNNLSLMALTIATGFVVDDAIVVLENITRLHVERCATPLRQACASGSREISFTVVSISLSLIAVFIPILLMGGVLGRLFHEFAVVLTAAILISHVGVADHHPDDVCGVAAPRCAKASPAQTPASGQVVPTLVGMGIAAPVVDVVGVARHDCVECEFVPRHPQRVFPTTRHRSHQRLYPRRPKHLVSIHATALAVHAGHCASRPGCVDRDRLHR
jgi:hypothetical protein